MALKKTFTLPEGYSAEYFRLSRIDQLDYLTKECVAIFSLYKDAATAASGAPIRPVAGRLALCGAKFDTYLAKSVLSAPSDVNAQLYEAAKAETMDLWFGRAVLNDAADC